MLHFGRNLFYIILCGKVCVKGLQKSYKFFPSFSSVFVIRVCYNADEVSSMEQKWKKWMIWILAAVLPILLLTGSLDDKKDADAPTQVQPGEAEKLSVRVLQADGEIAQMDMDTYLVCVLLGEIPGDFELETMKAQAVVARTYALRRNWRADKHSEAAVCVNHSCCQGYRDIESYLAVGGSRETVEKMRQAVEDTENLVLTFNGELIEATYFSSSGGRTEDAQSVWGADIPYLQAVDSPGEEEYGYYTDTVKFTADEFQQLLGDDLLGKSGTWIKSVTYTPGGGVDTIKIGNVTYTGTKLRSLLGLRSTAFVITAAGDSIIITTKGFGHRVGMSQYGADAMAVDGSDFTQILSHYYQNTQLRQWTP